MPAGTQHQLIIGDSREPWQLAEGSVDLVLTSPPYPMIQMWDTLFSDWHGRIRTALAGGNGEAAFDGIHSELDRVWSNAFDSLRQGGFLLVNVGDATRTIGDRFLLYPNHSRIIQACRRLGFDTLPNIIWRKQTNAPNKFMGSGMLPAGAYVTLEHEYILVFRKGARRTFTSAAEKLRRKQSALFWEERNSWFSDVWWDVKGARQTSEKSPRPRSAAFPFAFAYRLINMFSVQGDTVCDPFVGTGTTMVAAASSARNSVGFEIAPGFAPLVSEGLGGCTGTAREVTEQRLAAHVQFVAERLESGRTLKHQNRTYGFPVMTQQEIELRLPAVHAVTEPSFGWFDVTHAHVDESSCSDLFGESIGPAHSIASAFPAKS